MRVEWKYNLSFALTLFIALYLHSFFIYSFIFVYSLYVYSYIVLFVLLYTYVFNLFFYICILLFYICFLLYIGVPKSNASSSISSE